MKVKEAKLSIPLLAATDIRRVGNTVYFLNAQGDRILRPSLTRAQAADLGKALLEVTSK